MPFFVLILLRELSMPDPHLKSKIYNLNSVNIDWFFAVEELIVIVIFRYEHLIDHNNTETCAVRRPV